MLDPPGIDVEIGIVGGVTVPEDAEEEDLLWSVGIAAVRSAGEVDSAGRWKLASSSIPRGRARACFSRVDEATEGDAEDTEMLGVEEVGDDVDEDEAEGDRRDVELVFSNLEAEK